MDNSGDGHVLYGWSYSKSDRLLRRKGWWHLCETRLGWDNRHQLSPHPELVTRPGYWRHAHRCHHDTMVLRGEGERQGWLVTCFLIIPFSGLFEITDQVQDVSDGAPANKATVGQPCCAAARPRLLMAIIQCFMIRHQPGYWGPSSPAEYSHPGMSPSRGEIIKVVKTGRRSSDTSFAVGTDWAGGWWALSSCHPRPQHQNLFAYPGSQPRLNNQQYDDIWASWKGSALLI